MTRDAPRLVTSSATRPLGADEVARIITDLDDIIGRLLEPVTPDPGDKRRQITRAERARVRAVTYSPGPRAQRTDSVGRGSGTVTDPTGGAAVAPRDPSTFWAVELAVALRAADAIVGRVADLLAAIEAHAAPELDAATGLRTRRLGAGLCRACDHNAAGTDTDRLKGGLCDPCRMREKRGRDAGRWDDRTAFVRARRAELGLEPLDPDTEDDRIAGTPAPAPEEVTP